MVDHIGMRWRIADECKVINSSESCTSERSMDEQMNPSFLWLLFRMIDKNN